MNMESIGGNLNNSNSVKEVTPTQLDQLITEILGQVSQIRRLESRLTGICDRIVGATAEIAEKSPDKNLGAALEVNPPIKIRLQNTLENILETRIKLERTVDRLNDEL